MGGKVKVRLGRKERVGRGWEKEGKGWAGKRNSKADLI